ncbi:MAG: hypothetical protein M0R21_07690 [Lentimicrobiaceae bacterium]|jgi:hypothetical protein|nr:hypothetical protein [Lentimicrobiaceae bacterium]
MKKQLIIYVVIILTIFFVSCSKEAGEGGNSSIYGTIWVKDYNSSFTVLNAYYLSQDDDVYIIYDDDKGFSDRTRTNYKGVYSFKYLRQGTYIIYVYSKDSTLHSPSGIIPMIDTVKITKNNQNVKVPDITIFN